MYDTDSEEDEENLMILEEEFEQEEFKQKQNEQKQKQNTPLSNSLRRCLSIANQSTNPVLYLFGRITDIIFKSDISKYQKHVQRKIYNKLIISYLTNMPESKLYERDKFGITTLAIACRLRFITVAKLILDKTQNIENIYIPSGYGSFVIDTCAKAKNAKGLDTIFYTILQKTPIDMASIVVRSRALHFAILSNNTQKALALLRFYRTDEELYAKKYKCVPLSQAIHSNEYEVACKIIHLTKSEKSIRDNMGLYIHDDLLRKCICDKYRQFTKIVQTKVFVCLESSALPEDILYNISEYLEPIFKG